jgi:AcrR family transcriptional regulator
MNPGRDVPTSRSRRERPAKPALTRQGIIAVALDILRAEGLGKVTMRRIATALDTGPASLYVYIWNTEDLHAQILDALLAPLSLPGPAPAGDTQGRWQDRLKQLLMRYMAVLFDHPEIARMAMTTFPSGPNYLFLGETILSLLNEGGVPDRDAAWAVDLLLHFATAGAVEHSSRDTSGRASDEFSTLTTAVLTADQRIYPHIARLGAELMSGGPERIDWGLDVLLAGIMATPRPPQEKE